MQMLPRQLRGPLTYRQALLFAGVFLIPIPFLLTGLIEGFVMLVRDDRSRPPFAADVLLAVLLFGMGAVLVIYGWMLLALYVVKRITRRRG